LVETIVILLKCNSHIVWVVKLERIAYNSQITEVQSIKLARVDQYYLQNEFCSVRVRTYTEKYTRTKYCMEESNNIILKSRAFYEGSEIGQKIQLKDWVKCMIIIFSDNLLAHKKRRFYGKYFYRVFRNIPFVYCRSPCESTAK